MVDKTNDIVADQMYERAVEVAAKLRIKLHPPTRDGLNNWCRTRAQEGQRLGHVFDQKVKEYLRCFSSTASHTKW